MWFTFKDPLGLFNNIKDGYINIAKAEENQKEFKSDVIAQVKARSTSENLINEICQIMYSLYLAKEITKVSNNIKKSIKV